MSYYRLQSWTGWLTDGLYDGLVLSSFVGISCKGKITHNDCDNDNNTDNKNGSIQKFKCPRKKAKLWEKKIINIPSLILFKIRPPSFFVFFVSSFACYHFFNIHVSYQFWFECYHWITILFYQIGYNHFVIIFLKTYDIISCDDHFWFSYAPFIFRYFWKRDTIVFLTLTIF